MKPANKVPFRRSSMAKIEQNTVPEIIDSVEALTARMKAMRKAQKVFATYTQEQVDKIFFAAAMKLLLRLIN